jgi:hypothetical protein
MLFPRKSAEKEAPAGNHHSVISSDNMVSVFRRLAPANVESVCTSGLCLPTLRPLSGFRPPYPLASASLSRQTGKERCPPSTAGDREVLFACPPCLGKGGASAPAERRRSQARTGRGHGAGTGPFLSRRQTEPGNSYNTGRINGITAITL